MKKKRYDTIIEVKKFNPFHDAAGKFSSSNGFKSYSANPNTKAGAMAIARSAAAGHMNTVNVHRQAQATGQTIRQNANWLGQGKQQTPGQKGSATLNRRVEPTAGLAGASATGASWQYQNQQNGVTTGSAKKPQAKPAAKPAQQTTQQPQQKPTQQATQQKPAQQAFDTPTAQQKALGVDSVHLSSGDQLGIQPRNNSGQAVSTTKAADDHFQSHVVGKDISSTVDLSKVKGSQAPIDKMAHAQGWDKDPTVTNDLATFQKAAKQSGYMLVRSVHDDSMTGMSDMQVCHETMANGKASLGGSGAKFYGSGLYMVGANIQGKTGKNISKTLYASQDHSYGYGNKQMMATIHPSAKIATPNQAYVLESEFKSMLSASQRAKFGNDFGAYIASKGYDGARWHDDSTNDSTPYVTMYNKSAMIFYGGVADQY